MGLLSTFLGIFGFLIGSLIGIVIGFYLFIYSEPEDVEVTMLFVFEMIQFLIGYCMSIELFIQVFQNWSDDFL